MIRKESLKSYPDLLAFLDSKPSDLYFTGLQLNAEQLYSVEQYPVDIWRGLYTTVELTAAFGKPRHLHFFLNFKQEYNLNIEKYIVLATRHSNIDMFNYLAERFDLDTRLKHISMHHLQTGTNLLIRLIEAAAISNNIGALNYLLSIDKSGFAAMGMQYQHALKHTPLFYAASTNACLTFKRLLDCPKVKDYFVSHYKTFCDDLEDPSEDLCKEIRALKPKDLILPVYLSNRLGFSHTPKRFLHSVNIHESTEPEFNNQLGL